MMEFRSCFFAEVNENLDNASSSSKPAIVTSQVTDMLLQADMG